jgi:hypothetical protein
MFLNGLCLRWYVGRFPLSFTVFLAHLVKGNVSWTFHRCFLPSFSSFGLEVSDDGRQVMAKAHIAFDQVS